jgi:transposase-like protein
MVPVEARDSSTLLKVIEEKILPGTTIYSDCWKAYDCLQEHGYQHLKVNHSLNFVDPDTGAHTQHIECAWRYAKSQIPKYGRRNAFFNGYLARHIFIKTNPDPGLRFHSFLLETAKLYNPETL